MSDVTVAAHALLDEHAVETVEIAFCDLWGQLCGKRVPAQRFAERASHSFPIAPLTWSVTGEIAPSPLASPDNGFPNIRYRPDLQTLRVLPWQEATAICLLDGYDLDGEPFGLHGRHLVRRAVARLKALGYRARVAAELEFHLCTAEWEPLTDERRAFSLARRGQAETVLTEVRRCLERMGIVVEGSQTEYGATQFELNVAPSDPLRAADDAVLLKHAVKEIARRHGVRATFMPAPTTGSSMSGLHLHQSLTGLDGEPAWAAAGAGGSLPSYLAGVLRRAAECTAIYSPSINAYKRGADDTFAANRVCWGPDNRSVAVRVLDLDGPDARFELRTPSADANPYLAIAACLSAGTEGLEQRLEPPPPVTGNAYARDDVQRLPASLAEAVEALDASAFARGALGDALVDTLVAVQRLELERFAAHVTDWERERYLEHS
jgi:glutamine synthetase